MFALRSKLLCLLLFMYAICGVMAVCAAEESKPEHVKLKAAAPQDAHFYFVQITDTHLGQGNDNERTRKVVEAINALPYELACVVHTGDVFNDNIQDDRLLKDAKDIFGKLKYPLLAVPGNHDIRKACAMDDVGRFIDIFNGFGAFQECKGVRIIAICTEPLAQNLQLAGYQPFEYLRQALNDAAGKPAIIIHHTPSVESFYLNKLHSGWPDKTRKKWVGLLNQYNVKAVIAGHFHRDEMHWLGNVPLYVAPPVSSRFGRQVTFRIYEYNNDKLSYTTQYLE